MEHSPRNAKDIVLQIGERAKSQPTSENRINAFSPQKEMLPMRTMKSKFSFVKKPPPRPSQVNFPQ